MDSLVLNINDIGPDGRHLEVELDDEGVRALMAPTGLELAEGALHARISANLSCFDDAVSLRASIEGGLWTACSRCLGPAYVVAEAAELDLSFVPRARLEEAAPAEVELTAADLRILPYEGESLDLSAVVREQLVLAMPIAPLCRDDCEGVGVEASDGEDAGVSPWREALAQLKERIR